MPKILTGTGTFLFTALMVISCTTQNSYLPAETVELQIEVIDEIPPVPATDAYGFQKGEFKVETSQVRRNESLYIILRRHGLSPLEIDRLQRSGSDYANLSRMRPGQQYHLYMDRDKAVGMVWYLDRRNFLVMDWRDDEPRFQRDRLEVKTVQASVSGTIESSLFNALQALGASQVLGSRIAEIYAWEIDFFSLRRGDSFKAIYDELYIGDDFYGIGLVHSAEFHHRGNLHRAYYFEGDTQEGYFDEEGNSLERDLLKAPFTYNQRVSSGFSHNRLHPILNERRPHYGVDYAAPHGTPIIAVGDGRVTEARHRGGNGNIVQIRHNSVYRTAYLHMSRFAQGIRPGVEVRQGQVIGYVGATGLATGPHLCYRLYVNDSPVNSLTVDLPVSESLAEEYMAAFTRVRDRFDYELALIDIPQKREAFSSALSVDERN